jgi:hypothetical protein
VFCAAQEDIDDLVAHDNVEDLGPDEVGGEARASFREMMRRDEERSAEELARYLEEKYKDEERWVRGLETNQQYRTIRRCYVYMSCCCIWAVWYPQSARVNQPSMIPG